MAIKAWGNSLAIIFGAGAVLLAALNNKNWILFLFAAVFIFLISNFSKKK